LGQLHARDMAYVDMYKRENVLVGADGRPYLFDFQISYLAPAGWLGRTRLARAWLRILQLSDQHHAMKLQAYSSGDPVLKAEVQRRRPWWIKLHRGVAVPVRTLRRRLLVWLRVRTAGGQAESEHFAEAAIAQKRSARRAA